MDDVLPLYPHLVIDGHCVYCEYSRCCDKCEVTRHREMRGMLICHARKRAVVAERDHGNDSPTFCPTCQQDNMIVYWWQCNSCGPEWACRPCSMEHHYRHFPENRPTP